MRGIGWSARGLVGLVGVLVGVMLLSACGSERGEDRGGAIERVVVTIEPLRGLIEPLLGEGAEVTVLMPPGRDAHGWSPTPSDLAAIGKADVVVLVGLGLEPGVESFLARHAGEGRLVLSFGDLVGVGGHDHDHDHAHDHDHSHDHDHAHGTDPHVWLDPVLCARFVQRAGEELASRVEAGGGEGSAVRATGILNRTSEVIGRLEAFDERCRSELGPFRGRKIVTHHASFGWFAERYGLEVAEVIRPIESAEPTPGQIERVVRALGGDGGGVIFAEPQWSGGEVRAIAEAAGAKVETLDPLGNGDWFAMMEGNLAALVRGLGGDG
ncbi:MAG: metal ABC transporter substrate-binding protein [Phycisphaerales bacterium JB037]